MTVCLNLLSHAAEHTKLLQTLSLVINLQFMPTIWKWNKSSQNSTDHACRMAALKDEIVFEIHTLALAPKLH